MAIRNLEKLIELQSHPLEEHFGIKKGSTEIVTVQRKTVDLVKPEQYDEKDVEIEKDYQEIADSALNIVELLKSQLATSEPKYMARLAEVIGQQLNTALSAVDKKAKMKSGKDNYLLRKEKATTPKNVNQTLIINREALLDMMKTDGEDAKILDASFTEIKKDE